MKIKIKKIIFAGVIGLGAIMLVAFLFVGAASAQPKTGGRPPVGGGGKSASVFISKFVYATDAEGNTVKVAVDPGTKVIYSIVTIADPAPGSTFKFVWTLSDGATHQQAEVFSQEFSNQSGKTIACKYAPPGGLKKGTYIVQIFIDGRGRNRARLIVLKNQT